jgi:hypothetical protein
VKERIWETGEGGNHLLVLAMTIRSAPKLAHEVFRHRPRGDDDNQSLRVSNETLGAEILSSRLTAPDSQPQSAS